MRKLLARFLLTLRWLLVALLPGLGLLMGVWLKPEAKPRWEYFPDNKIECAGVVADEESTSLVVYHMQFSDMWMIKGMMLRLDIASGRDVARSNITFNQDHLLIPGTTYVVQPDTLISNRSFEVYDWSNNIRLAILHSSNSFSSLETFVFKNNVFSEAPDLIAGKISFWRVDGDQVHQSDCVVGRSLRHDLQLNKSGEWAVASYENYDLKNPALPFQKKVQLIDTESGNVLQTLPQDIKQVRWHPREMSFLALQRDSKTHTQYWQRYKLSENASFVPTGSPLPVSYHLRTVTQTPSPFIVLASLNTENPWRNRLSSILGKWGDDFVNRCWPEATTFHLYHSVTGELLNSLTLPYRDWSKHPPTVHPDPTGKGLIIESLNRLAYWEFQPANRWYPWIGLGVGVIFSIFVARWNLKRVIPIEHAPSA